MRTLRQRLDNDERIAFDDFAGRLAPRALAPLEATPMRLWAELYHRTVVSGYPISPTLASAETPASILADMIPEA